MHEQFNFVGSGITPADKKRATAYIQGYREGASRSFEAMELEKTAEEKMAIVLLNDFLQQEFSELNIAEIPELQQGQFHIVSDEWMEKNLQCSSSYGAYTLGEDAAVVGRFPSRLPIQHFKTIFHEGVHGASHSKFRLNVSKERIGVREYRVGYGIMGKNTDEENERVRFRVFNEGVVETIVERMFHRGRNLIQKKLAVSQGDFEKVAFAYPTSRAVVRAICQGMAEHSGKTSKEHWQQMERGQFTGEMMHLRDIEYTYGKGALRILDALRDKLDEVDIQENDEEQANEKNEKILQFFGNYDRKEESRELVRMELAQGILGEEDFKKYCL